MKETDKRKRALVVVDVQNDFCPGGSLPVRGGDSIIPTINALMKKFDIVVGTQDWHPKNHVSFASNHAGKKPFDLVTVDGREQVLWPDHCVQSSTGADFHGKLDSHRFTLIVRKGFRPGIDSYSAFFENDRITRTGLHGYLKGLAVGTVYICGLATDYCVYYSAVDALDLNYSVCLVKDASMGIDFPEGTVEEKIDELAREGAHIVSAGDVAA